MVSRGGGINAGDKHMFDNSLMIEVAIGLILLYLTVSLICTVVQEWIAQIGNWRAKNLEAAIIQLLNDGRTDQSLKSDNASTEAKKVLEHPLFKMMAPGAKAGITAVKDKPSYVTANNFALALIDALGPQRTNGKIDFAGLQTQIDALPNGALKKSLQPILDSAQGSLTEAISGVERWFDAAMDRASGWYTRNVKRWLVIIGAIVAVVANADTVQVALQLSRDSGLRSTIATYASTIAPPGAPQDAKIKELQTGLSKKLDNRQIESGFGGLPVGWGQCYGADAAFSFGACYRAQAGDWLGIGFIAFLVKIFGLFLTALSASLGAPFWFGLLQKVNAARGTGPKPVSSANPSGGAA